MKTAFAYWGERISPVFDSSRQIYVVEEDSGRIVGASQEMLPGDVPVQKVNRLVELGIATLVCGAISRQLRGLVEAHGIQVIPFVAGELEEIVRAWRRNGLGGDTFAMPGCSGVDRGRRKEHALANLPSGPGPQGVKKE